MMPSVRIADLQAEISRLTALVSAVNEDGQKPKTLSIRIVDKKFPPSLIITAPGMNERQIASYSNDVFALLFAVYRDLAADNSKAIKVARKIYLECADVAEKYGHGPCGAELRRRAEIIGAEDASTEPVVPE